MIANLTSLVPDNNKQILGNLMKYLVLSVHSEPKNQNFYPRN